MFVFVFVSNIKNYCGKVCVVVCAHSMHVLCSLAPPTPNESERGVGLLDIGFAN